MRSVEPVAGRELQVCVLFDNIYAVHDEHLIDRKWRLHCAHVCGHDCCEHR